MSATTCPACGHGTFDAVRSSPDASAGTCSRCGYASGEANRCPHCCATARVEGTGPSCRCAVCGGPRIPGNLGGEAAAAALKEQRKHWIDARLASTATLIQALFAAIATLIGLLLRPASIAGEAMVFAIAAVPLFFALRSRTRAAAARKRAKEAGERAWQAAAEDAAKQKGGITASQLAKTLGIDPEHADRLLTSLAVHDRTRVDVDDAAEVRFSVPPSPRFRIESKPDDEESDADEADASVAARREPAR